MKTERFTFVFFSDRAKKIYIFAYDADKQCTFTFVMSYWRAIKATENLFCYWNQL